jgi:streptogramin lyase
VHVVGRQSFFEAMRSFLLQHFFSDADMAAEMHAGSGAAHYDMDEYTVSAGGACTDATVSAAGPTFFTGTWCQHTS